MRSRGLILSVLAVLVVAGLASCLNDPRPEAYIVPEFGAVSVDDSTPGVVSFSCTVSSMQQLSGYGMYVSTGTSTQSRIDGLRTSDHAFSVRMADLQQGTAYSCVFFISNGRVEALSPTYVYHTPVAADPPKPMALRVRPASGGLVCLPLRGTLACTVDWGDGSTESISASYGIGTIAEGYVSHTYTAAGTFDVSISGTVTALSSHGLASTENVVAVLDWGQTGLQDLSGAFHGQAGLESVTVPADGAFAAVESMRDAFSGTALKQVPAGLLSACPAGCDYTRTFADCRSLESIPLELFPSAARLQQTFSGCIALASLPSKLLSDGSALVELQETFAGCKSLTSISSTLLSGCTGLKKAVSAFAGCSSLSSLPAELFDDCRALTVVEGLFMNCTALKGESPYTMLDGKKVHLYERSACPEQFSAITGGYLCFFGCTGLDDYASIPDNWKKP